MIRHSLAENDRWYVAATQPGKEALAAHHLVRQGYEVFSPLRPRTVRHARRTATLLAPVFPGYLFVSFDRSASAWRSINGTLGVRHVIAAADCPLPLPQGFVEGLAQLTDERGVLCRANDLKVGGRVQLLCGPFAERIGTLQDLDAKGRVAVLLDLFSTRVPLKVRVQEIMPV
jgi:transcription antitermination factor NusG